MTADLLVHGERLLLGGRLLADHDLLIAAGDVVAVGPAGTVGEARETRSAAVVAPGFVDVHVHSLDGCGLVGPGSPDVAGLSRALAARGVTGFLATTAAAPVPVLVEQLRAVAAATTATTATTAGARCLGAHLEGPWLSPDARGAQPVDALATPDVDDLRRLLAAGPVRLLTVAPELPGAGVLIEAATAAGVVVSMGHSRTTYDGALTAIGHGVRHVTHCYNAMSGLHHGEPGLVGAALDRSELTVELIADGVHVHPATVRLAWRAVGRERLCLVSDAVDLGDGDGPASRLPDGTLAGARVGLDAAVRNVVSWGVPLADALVMAAGTPAQVAGHPSLGSIDVGAPADLVLLDDDLTVRATLVAGTTVFERVAA